MTQSSVKWDITFNIQPRTYARTRQIINDEIYALMDINKGNRFDTMVQFSKRFIAMITLLTIAIVALFVLMVVLTVIAAVMGHDTSSYLKMVGIAGAGTALVVILFAAIYLNDKKTGGGMF